MAIQLQRRRFTADEYERMAQAGILDEDERIELIDGEILLMNPVNPPHVHCVMRVTHLLVGASGERARVLVQSPIRLADDEEPQPDLTLIRRPVPGAPLTLARPADILLLVEVSDTTRVFDRRVKVPRYARAAIQEVWLVDLTWDCIVVFREPSTAGYRSERTARRGSRLTLVALPEVTIAVDDILG